MKVAFSQPRSLGVDTLVYLSDVAPPSAATSPVPVKLVAAAGVLLAVFGKKRMRTAGIAVAAVAGAMLLRGGISVG